MAVRSNVLLPVEREKLKTGNRPLNVHAMKKRNDGVAIIARVVRKGDAGE